MGVVCLERTPWDRVIVELHIDSVVTRHEPKG